MNNSSRRQRANAWVWLYLTLFIDGETDTETGSTNQIDESPRTTSDEPETR